jgi:hypothetical protein
MDHSSLQSSPDHQSPYDDRPPNYHSVITVEPSNENRTAQTVPDLSALRIEDRNESRASDIRENDDRSPELAHVIVYCFDIFQ